MFDSWAFKPLLADVALGGGGVFHPLPTSFAFKVRIIKFCTELRWDKMNILQPKNPDEIDNDVTITSYFVLLSIKNC